MAEERLCPELCDYIIDFLHDDHAALRACALVCRSWVPASRTHLFYHLSLTGSPSVGHTWAANTACRRIFATMLSSPHLASYVNRLSVKEALITQPAHYRWVSDEITFPSLLKKLKGLKDVEFHFPTPGPSDPKMIWSTLVFKDISEAMSSLKLDSFTIRQFSFSTLADFVKILDCFSQLKTLQLDSVDVTTATHLSVSALEHVINLQMPNNLTETMHKKTELQNLLLRSNSSTLIIPVLLHARSPLDISSLTSLVINITTENYSNVVELLTCTPNLETVELEIATIFDYEAHLEHKDTIDLHSLPSLRSLSLQFSVLLARTDPMHWLVPFLSTIGQENTLSTISMTCIIDKPPPFLTIQAFDNALAGWRNLDDLLTQPTFSALQRFRLDFALDNPIGDETPQVISEEYIRQLHNLDKKGVLEIDICEVR